MHKCKSCMKILTDTDDAIQCSATCSKWLHIECAGISKSLYKSIKSVRNIQWHCNDCNNNTAISNITLMENNDKRILDLVQRITNVEGMCENLAKSIDVIKQSQATLETTDEFTLFKTNITDKVNLLTVKVNSLTDAVNTTPTNLVTSSASASVQEVQSKPSHNDTHNSDNYKYQFKLHGVAESICTTAIDRMNADLTVVKNVLTHLQLPNATICNS